MDSYTIYILDDHELFSKALKSSIEGTYENTKVRIFLQAEDLYQTLPEEEPNVVIADLMLASGTGLEAISRVRAIYKNVKAILISSAKEEQIKDVCIESGIQGYIYKSELEQDIIAAIDSVLNGGTYYSNEIQDDDIEIVQSYDKINPFSKLTKRELEVIVCLSKGMTYSEIAKKMEVSRKTVNNHRVNITKKLGKMSLQHLLAKAQIWGVIKENNIVQSLPKCLL